MNNVVGIGFVNYHLSTFVLWFGLWLKTLGINAVQWTRVKKGGGEDDRVNEACASLFVGHGRVARRAEVGRFYLGIAWK